MEKNIKLTRLLEDMEEGSAFDYAALQAKKSGKDSFKLGDEEFPVKEQDQYDPNAENKWDRFWEVGGRQLHDAAIALIDDGFEVEDIIDYIQSM
jgi:hypothetical protein